MKCNRLYKNYIVKIKNLGLPFDGKVSDYCMIYVEWELFSKYRYSAKLLSFVLIY